MDLRSGLSPIYAVDAGDSVELSHSTSSINLELKHNFESSQTTGTSSLPIYTFASEDSS